MLAPGRGGGEERQWGVPSPSPSPQTFAASFTFYFRCHGFCILGAGDVELLASLGGEEAALQQAFFLSVRPKSFLQSLLREDSWAVFGLLFHFFSCVCLSLNI